MNETNKSLRVRTNVGEDKYISVNLTSEYDTLDILSLKINQRGAYRYHINTYGVVVGRVLANNGFGVPNAKLSLFIARDDNANIIEQVLYPYTTVGSKNVDGIRYNLLPSNQKDNCHQVVGTFPSKRMVLDDNSIIEVFEKYYTYTTRSNESGDFMFFGVPVGTYTLHMDLDISDCGKLSQRPRDFVYKGYNLEQFENPNQFKIDTELSSLPQVFSQDTTIEVKPFWGDEKEGTNIGITREDINVNYKFEPTCVFMGSIISDTPNDGINKRCVATNKMGDMREIVTGPGTIEIIRKTVNNTVEELQIKGKQLINGNGVWCFQIPMNLDYITTDEYGNTVPTDNPDKGIPTRCEVRFRMSMDETQAETIQYKRGKVLVPNNPNTDAETDYEFGSDTKDESFKSLMWNGVYSVKSFIPRFQKSVNIRTNKFTGIKNVNIHGSNNPMPYNNIRIKIPFMFWLMCNIIKLFIRIIQVINFLKVGLMNLGLGLINLPYGYIGNEVCPDLEYWYFAPGMNTTAPSNTAVRRFLKWLTGKDNRCKKWEHESTCLTFKEIANNIKSNNTTDDSSVKLNTLYQYIGGENDKLSHVVTYDELVDIVPAANITNIPKMEDATEEYINSATNDYKSYSNWVMISTASAPLDKMSTEAKNALTNIEPKIHLTPDVDYLMQCVEMNLAQEYEVIKFDFYNDWINGTIYLPRWSRDVKYKRKRKNGETEYIAKVKGCIDDKKRSRQARKYVQQCSLTYNSNMQIKTSMGCSDGSLQCHKKAGMEYHTVLGSNGGAVHEYETMLGDNVYYMKPRDNKAIMFATDIIMLGTLFDCNEYGIPSIFESLVSTTYKLPTNLAMTNVDEDGYSYVDTYDYENEGVKGPPTVSQVLNEFKCGDATSGCTLDRLAGSGVTATIPSYNDLTEFLKNRGDISSGSTTNEIVIEYDDIFPVTEMSGIEWGYTGPDQTISSSDKLFSPGGHFMGLACGNAETNIKSCVNLKRACEIGTTFSERLEIPVGFNEEADNFDVVNYLYITPNGVIGKDQVVDVTFRSAFATMNQNSLQTETDPVTKHKKYVFKYLIPDSFDGTIEQKIYATPDIQKLYNNRVKLEWDNYWAESQDEWLNDELLQKEILLEQGYTINRLINTKSEDYIKFRHGSTTLKENNFLKFKDGEYSMPQYKNSFYFYFGLKEGNTALDEFRREFFAPCALSTIVGERKDIEYEYKRSDVDFRYDVRIDVLNMVPPLEYKIQGDKGELYKGEGINNDSFDVKKVRIGVYDIVITDSNGETIHETIEIGVDDFVVDYDVTTISHYKEKEERQTIEDFAKDRTNDGFIEGTFEVTEKTSNSLGLGYKVTIACPNDLSIDVGDANWNLLFSEGKFYACGVGTYEVYIYETQNGVNNGYKYLYGSFTIEDGIPAPQVRLGAFDYFNENGTSDFKNVSLETAIRWNDYDKYRTIVSTEKMGIGTKLAFSYGSTDTRAEEIYAGKPSHIQDNELYENVCLKTDIPAGYELDFNYLKHDGQYYYTVFSNDIFATPYKSYKVGNSYVDMSFNEKGYYCIVENGTKKLYYVDDITKNHRYNVESDADKIIVGLMVSAPLYFYPFSFKVVKSLNTDKYLSFDIQAFQESISEEEVNGGKKIVYSDGKDNKHDSRMKVGYDIPNFGQPTLKYSHSGKSFEFRIGALNESLKDAEYNIVSSVNEKRLCFDSEGDFIVSSLSNNDYKSMIKADKMEQKNTSGTKIAEKTLSVDNVKGETLWSFASLTNFEGSINEDYRYNDIRECNFIKTFQNVLSFPTEPIKLFNGVKINNRYVDKGIYEIYEQNDNGGFTKVNNIYANIVLKCYDSPGAILTVRATENNQYRYGEVFKCENRINDETIGGEIDCSIDDEIYFTKNEQTDSTKAYEIFFEYFENVAIETELNDGIQEEPQNMLFIAAKRGDEVLEYLPLDNEHKLKLTYKELTEITSFEILLVINHKK